MPTELKFKQGDRVKIVSIYYAGRKGTVGGVFPDAEKPYWVYLDKDRHRLECEESELELLEAPDAD
jgi:transcription antitermination factor NusG